MKREDLLLPAAIRVEVKFTTGDNFKVPSRELESLKTGHSVALPIIAVIFSSRDRDVDGRWFIVDARRLNCSSGVESWGCSQNQFMRLVRRARDLRDLQELIAADWPQLLATLLDKSLEGHKSLNNEFHRWREMGRCRQLLWREKVLDVEHTANFRRLHEHHGDQVTGGILQDLFAFLLLLAGYGRITVNPVGVPDVEAHLVKTEKETGDLQSALTAGEIRIIADYCRRAGDENMARRIEGLGGTC